MRQPLVLQAEAYRGQSYFVMTRNGHTENVVELTRRYVSEPIVEVPNFAAFLEQTAPAIQGASVIVALGDSRTSNFSNWPRAVAKCDARDVEAVVVNLADWARTCEEHVPVLQFYLDWLKSHGAAQADIVVVLGLTDIVNKIDLFADFMKSQRSEPVSDAEIGLRDHKYGSELARLGDDIPTEWADAYQWVPRRILAAAKLLDRLCADAGRRFFAILEPTAYEDCAPGYITALHAAYEAEADRSTPFDDWCIARNYAHNPSIHRVYDLRGMLETLRELWRAQDLRSNHGRYIDWSDLFRDIEECCFQSHFDAVHYNERGVGEIARAAADILRR